MYGSSYTSESSDSDDALIIEYITNHRRRTNIRRDQFLWEDIDFEFRYRFSKASARYLVNLIQNKIRMPSQRNNAVNPAEQVLLALRFYATGSMQQILGDVADVHKSTVCKCVFRVSQAIASLRPQYIYLPRNREECEVEARKFYSKSLFPRVIGAIDCTHIAINSVGGRFPELYRNRKGYFSYNVQTVVDADLRIRNIACHWPGSTHDSTIFSSSLLKARMETAEFGGFYLVGDSAYPATSYMMTPLLNPTTPGEMMYNTCQIRARNPVERAYGVWKRRFPCIGQKLRVHQNRIQCVIVATAVLHNFCIERRERQYDNHMQDSENDMQVEHQHLGLTHSGAERRMLINTYFNGLAST